MWDNLKKKYKKDKEISEYLHSLEKQLKDLGVSEKELPEDQVQESINKRLDLRKKRDAFKDFKQTKQDGEIMVKVGGRKTERGWWSERVFIPTPHTPVEDILGFLEENRDYIDSDQLEMLVRTLCFNSMREVVKFMEDTLEEYSVDKNKTAKIISEAIKHLFN